MKIALELEFPDEQAASIMVWLQNLPSGVAHFVGRKTTTAIQPDLSTAPVKSEAELGQLFQQLAGSWQSNESGEELARQLYEARSDQPRDIEL